MVPMTPNIINNVSQLVHLAAGGSGLIVDSVAIFLYLSILNKIYKRKTGMEPKKTRVDQSPGMTETPRALNFFAS